MNQNPTTYRYTSSASAGKFGIQKYSTPTHLEFDRRKSKLETAIYNLLVLGIVAVLLFIVFYVLIAIH